MADNVPITGGAGYEVATDNVGDVHYQVVKLDLGGDGVSDPVVGELRVREADGDNAALGATTDAAVSTDTTGTISGKLRGLVALMVNFLSRLPAALGGAGGLKTEVVAALPAGSAAIGKLAANSGVDIGDVDVTSVTPGTAAANLGKAEDAAHSSGDVGVMALGVRQDSIAALGADGDYIPPTMDANGQMRVLAGSPDFVVSVTPTLDTNAYAAGDLLFDSTEIAAAVRANGGTAILQSITMLDKADQGVGMTLVFANAATDFGTLNAAPDPDDTESGTVIGLVAVVAADYLDLGANKVACIRNIGLMMKAGAATTSLYVAAVNGTGTPTYANGDLVLQLCFMRS